MNKLVIFDLDGTLLDTAPDMLININKMLSQFNYPLLSMTELKAFIGRGARNLVIDACKVPLQKEEIDDRLAVYNNFYTNSGSPNTKIFDGIGEVINTIKQRGYKIAILTNKPQETTDEVYKTYIKDYNFDIVVGQSGSVRCKPDKTATLNILKKFNVEPKNCYFVGDGETDVLTAINANVNGIAVLWGYRDKEKLLSVGAKTFVLAPSDLLKIIQ